MGAKKTTGANKLHFSSFASSRPCVFALNSVPWNLLQLLQSVCNLVRSESPICATSKLARRADVRLLNLLRAMILCRMWVSVFVRFAETLGADMRVNLRRRETFVAQQFLYGPQIGTAIEEMRGERMP